MEQGTQFHALMAKFWNDRDDDFGADPIGRAVERVMYQEGPALLEQGVVCVECVLGGPDDERLRHGRYPGTCDLVTDNGNGLTVTDYKTKAKLDQTYVHGELLQTRRSWQFKQYAWFVQERFQRPVTHVRKLLVAFKPTLRVWLEPSAVTQEELSSWKVQADYVWGLMDEMEYGNIPPWRNADACTRYGWEYRCDHYESCWLGQPIEYKESAQ